MNRTIMIIVVVLLVIGAAGAYLLSSYSKPAATTPDTSSSTHAKNETSQTAQATDKVAIKDFSFSPAAITVKKGTTVTWTNQDSTAHTVTSTDSQGGPKSGTLNKGDTYTFMFDSVGTFKYKCTFHSSMTGTVTVTE